VDAPDLGGFISSTTIVKASLWRMGQLKSGDTIQYRRVSLKDALRARAELEQFLESVSAVVAGQCDFDTVEPISNSTLPESTVSGNWGKALIYCTELGESGIPMTFRQVRDSQGYYAHQFSNRHWQGGDEFLLVEFGDGKFNLNHRCRVTALDQALKKSQGSDEVLRRAVYKTTGCCNCVFLPGSIILELN
jgi:hypothetical protein